MKSLRREVFHTDQCSIFSSLNYCIFINPKIDLFHILAQATSVLSGGINIGERLIGGETVLINLAEK